MERMIDLVRKTNPYLMFVIKKAYQDIYINKIYKLLKKREMNKTEKILINSSSEPVFLESQMLEFLHNEYPIPHPFIYDQKNLEQRERVRVFNIFRLMHSQKIKIKDFLEIGCGKGICCYILKRFGANISGIDVDDNFDEKAKKIGVNLIKMDASNLKFKEENFDFVYSYDSFEHFLDPEKVLKEAIRVTKKSGYIYISLGLPYNAPWGPHAYRSINFPYWQHLFNEDLVKSFIIEKNLHPLPEYTFNKWKVADFRNLWKKYSEQLKIIKYKETLDLRYLSLIRRYPSCFKSKINNFEDLIVTTVEILFKKLL